MATYTQANRVLIATTPLGKDVLLLTAFQGREELSRPFQYVLEFVSEKPDIDAKAIVGKPVSWMVQPINGTPRHFSGVVSRFSAGGQSSRSLRQYRAEVVPWLWLLTRGADCRIFQKKTVPQVIEQVFKDLGFADFKPVLKGSYPQLEYCVQYRETHFDFVSRLMEEAGIFYFFQHEAGKHTLILADAKSAYVDCPEKSVEYSNSGIAPRRIHSWEHQYEFRTGKWAQTDYNFETPSTSLVTKADTLAKVGGNDKFEVFDYPGRYGKKADGEPLTKIRMEEAEAGYDTVQGQSTCNTFTPGGKFTLTGHEYAAEKKGYVITSIMHSGVEESYVTGPGGKQLYDNKFTCIPDSVTFRPPRVTPRPFVHGPQTAEVVGPKGEEIYTDKYGRVKVQFFWDRQGKRDENSSCWVRVAENWAGKNWGMVFNPRIGQEVIVEFLEGDPDRPIITGRVYNAEQMPPYKLPDCQTLSGLKTRSSKGGGDDNFNEIWFEDKKGEEEVYIRAERDLTHYTKNDQWDKVLNNRDVRVGNHETLNVEKGHRIVTIGAGNEELYVEKGNRLTKIEMGNQTTKLDLGKSETEAMQSIELKVGQNSIKIDQTGVTIKGLIVKVEGQIQTQVKGLMTQINADAILMLKGGITMLD
jgi:type VI secretion system secreted protein VgrG